MKVDIYNTDKKYNIIYADPPWSYNVASAKGTSRGVAERYYNTMKLEDIKNLPIDNLCENAVLFLWATFPNLPQAFEVIKAWNFTYKTVAFNWTKIYPKTGNPILGCGYWTRANGEICLLATKGKKYPRRINAGIQQAIIEPKREHSRKPDVARDRIVELLGDIPRIELFARQQGGMKSKGLNKGCRNASSNVVSNMSDFNKEKIYNFLDTVKSKMKEINMYIFSSKLQVPYYLNWALENKCQFDILIWDKDFTGIISRKFFANNNEYIIRIYKKGLNRLEDNMFYQKIHKFKRPSNKLHEAQKPVELLKRFILLSSNENDTVLDCFMGSGSTGVACINTNRNFMGIELDKHYFEIAKERIEKAGDK